MNKSIGGEPHPLVFLREALIHLTTGWIDVELNESTWCITRRPNYCDRGQFLWQCESKDNLVMTIDVHDGFPRYFFGLDPMLSEMGSWCKARKQQIKNIHIGGDQKL